MPVQSTPRSRESASQGLPFKAFPVPPGSPLRQLLGPPLVFQVCSVVVVLSNLQHREELRGFLVFPHKKCGPGADPRLQQPVLCLTGETVFPL